MKSEESAKEAKLIHEGFEITVFLKGLDGLLEIIGGFILIFLPLAKINQILLALTRKEITEDPKDLIANYLIHLSQTLSISALNFTILFLLVHGFVKVFLVIFLVKRRIWAYPTAMVVFGLFGLYQIYQYSFSHSIGLLLLTILDVVVIILTWFEFNNLKRKLVA